MRPRLIKNIIKSSIKFIFRKPIPLAVGWAVTSLCSNKCLYCDIASSGENDLSTKECLEIIDQIADSGTVYIGFTGGEPLQRDDIGLLVTQAKRRGLFVSINTNGNILPEKINEIKHVDRFSISLDGDKETHDMIRGKGSFDKVIASADLLKKYKIKTNFVCVLNSKNIKKIDEIKAISKRKKIKVLFQPVEEYHSSGAIGGLEVSPKDMRSFVKDIFNDETRLNSKKCLLHFIKPKINKTNCGAGKIFCRIDPDGSMFACGRSSIRDNAPKVKDGFLMGFKKISKVSCNSCLCVNYIESSLIYNWSPSNLFSLLF